MCVLLVCVSILFIVIAWCAKVRFNRMQRSEPEFRTPTINRKRKIPGAPGKKRRRPKGWNTGVSNRINLQFSVRLFRS